MPPPDLRSYLALLDQHHDLARIAIPVDPLLEIAAITDRVCKRPGGGRALLFEQPLGARFRVATNLFGSQERVCQALGMERLDQLTAMLSALLDEIASPDLARLDSQIAALPAFSRYAPRLAAAPDPHLTPMALPDLTSLPFLHCWPEDGSAAGCPRYLTLAQVYTVDPDGGTPNCGLYRVQLRGPQELAIQWKPGSGAARHAELYRQGGREMPVAIGLGGNPALLFSALCPLPGTLDEITFAGFLHGSPMETHACRTVPLAVPVGLEIVIEGTVAPGETVLEGPFGNHSGCYAPAAPAALLRVSALRHRPDAIIPATLVGPPPMEDCWMAAAWERLLVALVRRFCPQVTEIHFPHAWVFHGSAIISLEKPHPGMVREIAGLFWGTPWFSAARLLVFVASEDAPADEQRIAWRSINLIEYGHDLIFDPSGTRLALDATGSRGDRRPLPPEHPAAARVAAQWDRYGDL